MLRRTVLGAGIAWLALQGTAWAVFGIADTAVVHDPLALIQTTATATRMYQNNANQIIQMGNDLQHLVALPTSLVEDVMGTVTQYTSLLDEGSGFLRDMQGNAQRFQQFYEQAGKAPLTQSATQLLGMVRTASQSAARAQGIYTRIRGQEQSLRRLAEASKAAPGTLAALQAQNQLQILLAAQQADLQGLQATSGQLEMTWIMRQVVAEEQAQRNAATYLLMPDPGAWELRAKPGPRMP